MNIINFLKDAQLVADFQHFFGIQSIDVDSDCPNGNYSSNHQTTKLKRRQKNELTNGYSNHTTKNGLSNGLNNQADLNDIKNNNIKAIKPNFKINNLAFYYLFCFGASLGYEIFYAIFFPFFLHNIDSYVARRYVPFFTIRNILLISFAIQ